MTYLSHQDGEHTGRASRELAEHLRFLDNDINDLNGKLRRAAHIVVFAVFTFLLGLTLKIGGTNNRVVVLHSYASFRNRHREAFPQVYDMINEYNKSNI